MTSIGKFTPDIIHTDAGEHLLSLKKSTKTGRILTHESKIMIESDRKVAVRVTDFMQTIDPKGLDKMLDFFILEHIFNNNRSVRSMYGSVEQWLDTSKGNPAHAAYQTALAKGAGEFVHSSQGAQILYKAGDLLIPLDLPENPDNVKDVEIETAVRKIADLILSGAVDDSRARGIYNEELKQYLKRVEQKPDAVKSW